MPCACHGAKGEVVKGKVPPDSPCTVCASKHINLATTAWGEFTYEEDNREFVASHLRLAGEHLKTQHRTLALEVRDVAMAIEMGKDKGRYDIANRLRTLRASVRAVFNMEHPDVTRNLDKLTPVPRPGLMDVIVPLGHGSPFNNDEIRILLRSIEKNCKSVGRIIIVSDCAPDWLNREALEILDKGDSKGQGKDANLIDKTMAAIDQYNVRSFVWMADDNVILKPLDLLVAPKLYNSRDKGSFTGEHKWHRRMRHTFEMFPQLTYNFDTHTPQPFHNAQRLVNAMRGIDYITDPGTCIMTTFYAALGEYTAPLSQADYKNTVEGPVSPSFSPQDKLYLGYNDTGFSALREKLFAIFPDKSRFELTDRQKPEQEVK